MKENWTIPSIDNRFVCIANITDQSLAAVVSSYFAKKGLYFPVFIFPDVNTFAKDEHTDESDHFISSIIGNETGVLINNALAKMTGCNYLIYLNLSGHQKSYIEKYGYDFPTIDIKKIDEVAEKLKPHMPIPQTEFKCQEKDVLIGLIKCGREGLRLVIDETAEELIEQDIGAEGFVLVEKDANYSVTSVIGVNYALSLGADIRIVEALNKNDRGDVELSLNRWRDEGTQDDLEKVLEEIRKRITNVNFSQYKYATFFTNGLPYSLAIKNIVPCTHVRLTPRPDFFVCNSIGVETGDRFHSAVIFSPGFFKEDAAGEETEAVKETLSSLNYYTRLLLGDDATARNLDFHAQHFPYDLLHITSHGGNADGQEVTTKYVDRDGVEHIVIYDEVVSFAWVGGDKPVEVTLKAIPRKFDGLDWMSEELRQRKIPDYIFVDMNKRIGHDVDASATRKKKSAIPLSNVIYTIDGFHQGIFRILASHNSPVIFNNSCRSWGETSSFFISSGTRGYVGTLWEIGNSEAVKASEVFYKALPEYSVMTALHRAIEALKATESENIYLYWGLHFTSVASRADSQEESRARVFKELLRAFVTWGLHVKNLKDGTVKNNSRRVFKDIGLELLTNFGDKDLKKLMSKTRGDSSAANEGVVVEQVPPNTPEQGHVDQLKSEQAYRRQRNR